MELKCQKCCETFDTLNKLHRHIKKCHGMSQKEYYETFFPKFDLWDHSIIEFTAFEKYTKAQFNNVENAINFYKHNGSSEISKSAALEYFFKRDFKKMPTQSELRCRHIPSIIGLEKIFGDYYSLCEKFNWEPRFTSREFCIENVDIVTDTREQKPEFVDQIEKLEVGDYTTFSHFSGVFVERKSGEDFIGTFSRKNNLERFLRELERAQKLGFFLVVYCDSNIENIFNWQTNFSQNLNLGKVALSNMGKIMQSCDCCQFLFSNKNPKQTIKNILGMGSAATKVDLQYLKDTKLL